MALPVQYREGGGNFVFNVDYFDYIQNAGYKSYYLLGTKDSVGNKYTLTPDIIESDQNNRIVSNGAFDIDFDLNINNGVTIANATCTVTYKIYANAGSGFNVTTTIYHYDGSTETSLGSATDAGISGANTNRQTVQFTLTEKKFNKGDILRVNIASSGGTYVDTDFHYNPADADEYAKINLPFKIQQ